MTLRLWHDVDAYQREAIRTSWLHNPPGEPGYGTGNMPPLAYLALGLAGEAGEFADHVKKCLRDNVPINMENAVEELGDMAWYLAIAARELGHDLSDVLDKNVRKLKARYPDGFDAQRSLHRGPREDHPYKEAKLGIDDDRSA